MSSLDAMNGTSMEGGAVKWYWNRSPRLVLGAGVNLAQVHRWSGICVIYVCFVKKDWMMVVSTLCTEAKSWANFAYTGDVGQLVGSASGSAPMLGGRLIVEDIDKALFRCQDTSMHA